MSNDNTNASPNNIHTRCIPIEKFKHPWRKISAHWHLSSRKVELLVISSCAWLHEQRIRQRKIELYAQVVGGQGDTAPRREWITGRWRITTFFAEHVPELKTNNIGSSYRRASNDTAQRVAHRSAELKLISTTVRGLPGVVPVEATTLSTAPTGLVSLVRIEHQTNGNDSLPNHEGIGRLACELEVEWRTGLLCSITSIGDNQLGTLEVGATSARRSGIAARSKRRSWNNTQKRKNKSSSFGGRNHYSMKANSKIIKRKLKDWNVRMRTECALFLHFIRWKRSCAQAS